jgi:long-chain acyl-CoA synthetase
MLPAATSWPDVVTTFNRLNEPAFQSAVFLDMGTRKVPYRHLTERVGQLASLFARHGLREGDRLVVSVVDEVETACIFWALLRYGITAILLDPEVKPGRARALLQKAEPAGFIADEAFLDRHAIDRSVGFVLPVKAEEAPKGQLFRKLLGRTAPAAAAAFTYPAVLTKEASGALPTAISPDTVAYVLFTSGTTSDTKGVQITHRNLFTHLRTLSNVYSLSTETRLLNILLLYHADGIIQGPVLAAYNAATCVRPLRFELSQIGVLLDAVYKYRVTHMIAVPAMLALIQRFSDGYEDCFRTPDFRFIISVSSHLEEALWSAFAVRFAVIIVNVYGLTETVAGGLFSGPTEATYRIGTVGKPVDMQARIVDEQGRELGEEQEGELQLRGENVMRGYLHNEAATAEVLLEEGWLASGDMARRSADGFYRITGRRKNIIVSGGVNIHPEEITEILNTHPAVLEAVSFGMPDAVFGEKLISCVVLTPGQEVTEVALLAFCREHMEEEKIPAAIHQLPTLPKGLSGKVQLNAVREQLVEQVTQAAGAGPDFRMMVRDAAAASFKVPLELLKPEANSHNIAGWDSMAHLDFVVRLEKALGTEFSTAEIMVMNSLQNAEEVARKKFARR